MKVSYIHLCVSVHGTVSYIHFRVSVCVIVLYIHFRVSVCVVVSYIRVTHRLQRQWTQGSVSHSLSARRTKSDILWWA